MAWVCVWEMALVALEVMKKSAAGQSIGMIIIGLNRGMYHSHIVLQPKNGHDNRRWFQYTRVIG